MLQWAVMKGDTKIIERLLDCAGINVLLKNSYNESPLDVTEDIEIKRMLEKYY